jgi:hypothetical protein
LLNSKWEKIKKIESVASLKKDLKSNLQAGGKIRKIITYTSVCRYEKKRGKKPDIVQDGVLRLRLHLHPCFPHLLQSEAHSRIVNGISKRTDHGHKGLRYPFCLWLVSGTVSN